MASEITVTLLRFAFLALLWVFIFMILAAARRDLGVGRNFRTTLAVPAADQVSAEPRQTQPAPPARPTQLVITDGAQAGAVMRLTDQPVTMGRATDIEVSLQDDYASGRHARLFPQGSRWFLEDLGSTNGTFVGGTRLTRAVPIEPGSDFRVGRTTMQLRP
ncbi:FHA domain-containing protein [uncultured Rothia sp.]|uniref:FHA domain-containing protein FhaB/FipA n=1 Tax=uncultured Rothia sp. TaxID=316088 RepID=UPI003217E49F